MATESKATASCGCGCGGAANAGGGRRAVAVDHGLKTTNLQHLARIEGQVRGVYRMIEEDRYCTDILTQIVAARESLQSVAKTLLKNHLRHCARSATPADGREVDELYGELVDLVVKIAR